MPTKVHGFGGRSGGDPQGEQAHHHAAKVCQKVGRISHDGQAVGQVASCKSGGKMTLGTNDNVYEPGDCVYNSLLKDKERHIIQLMSLFFLWYVHKC